MNNLDMVQCEDTDGGLLRDLPSIASQISARLLSYRRHILQLEAEVDRLEAELGKATEADKPATAPVPTWEPPADFGHGKYVSTQKTLTFPSGDFVTHKALGWLYPGCYETPQPGEWHVQSGDATYLSPNEESPQ